MDISGKHTAIGFSLMNMSGNLGAIVCPIVVGYLIAYLTRSGESWDAVLYLFAANYLAAAICWLLLDPNQSAVREDGERSGMNPGSEATTSPPPLAKGPACGSRRSKRFPSASR